MSKLILLFLLALSCSAPSTCFAETARSNISPIAPGATLQKLAGGFSFTEGPACDSKGNVYFTDQPNDKILRWDASTGKVTTFLHPSGRANGMCFDARGDLWTCSDAKNELWEIRPDGTHRVVVGSYGGHLLNGPNDVWINPKTGGLYLTDPYYKRPYWNRGPIEQAGQEVFYLPPHGTVLTPVVLDMQMPNGIIGTPDGKTLYVSDIGAGQTFAYDIQPDGMLAHKRLFCPQGSDGMTIDSAGNVYLTGRGVTIVSQDGYTAGHIDIPEGWTGNVCFGGKDRHLLFITASKSVYGLWMSVHGVGSQ